MKKVLALVLAVVMVCTMAFAVTVGSTDTTYYDGGTGVYTTPVVLMSGKTAYVKIAHDVFDTIYGLINAVGGQYATLNTDWKTDDFTVAIEGDNKDVYVMKASFDSAKDYRIYFKDQDKALDDKADFVISALSIKCSNNDTLSTFNFGLKDGKLVVTSYQIDRIVANDRAKFPDTADRVKAITVIPGFDVGYAPADAAKLNATTTDVIMYAYDNAGVTYPYVVAIELQDEALDDVSTYSKATCGWFVNNFTKVLTANVKDIDTGSTFKFDVASKTYVKFAVNEAIASTSKTVTGLKEILEGVQKDCTNNPKCFVIVPGFTGTANVNATFKGMASAAEFAVGGTYEPYGLNADGSMYVVTGFTYNAAKDTWNYNGTTMPNVVFTTVKNVPTVAAPAVDGGTGTTNPATGANDVIGVAAALAVVALVSGAAISLKK